ncbi:MAG: hypothetical protein B7Z31_04405 [Rhodobacterales bacterium 12-65-15]|nr:MAG: hypothetical protein B7Z31_04405 [Rhodobacterales bacterium 12-65-15]
MRTKVIPSHLRRGRTRDARCGVASMAVLAMLSLAGMAEARCADLALVLAIDASGSINPGEFALQQQGYAAAFRSAPVQSALAAAGTVDIGVVVCLAAAGTVDIGVVVWGDTAMALQILGFQRVDTPADAEALALRIADLPRTTHGNTGIGRGVAAAVDLLAGSEGCASRSVVNVSGDGPESLAPRPRFHMPLATARQRAADLGITINALAIETEAADLADWYRDNLITGPGAFVMKVDGFEDFAAAIEAKLVREITPLALAAWEADLQSLTFTAATYQAPDRRMSP